MTISGDSEPDAVPLGALLFRLGLLRNDLREARQLGESGVSLRPEHLSRRLDEVDRWLDELIAILGERGNGSIDA